jgi:hypothetical protein
MGQAVSTIVYEKSLPRAMFTNTSPYDLHWRITCIRLRYKFGSEGLPVIARSKWAIADWTCDTGFKPASGCLPDDPGSFRLSSNKLLVVGAGWELCIGRTSPDIMHNAY